MTSESKIPDESETDQSKRLLAPSLSLVVDPPSVMTVVDFDGGGRGYLMMTDRNPADVKIDQPVEMTFRRMYEAEGFTNYYWKCRPVRDA